MITNAIGDPPTVGTMTSADVEVFTGIDPARLLDTRDGTGASNPGAFGPGETRSLAVAGFADVPSNATGVAINVTLPRSASSSSFVTVWPSGLLRPDTSTNNATPGQAVPNFAISSLGDGGAIDVFNERGDTHIVIDVVGYYVTLSSIEAAASPGGQLFSGQGAPIDSMGDDGDFYIDEIASIVYKKVQDEWGEPMAGLVGDAGPKVIAGRGAPSPSDGAIGDEYLDADALELYGPKTASGWGSPQAIGPDGNGSAFRSGSGAPAAGLGSAGDLYLDSANAVLYGPKAGAGWGAGVDVGPDGIGATFLSGIGAPDDTNDGVDGDSYLDTDALDLYGPKVAGAWPAPISLLTPSIVLVGDGAPLDSDGADGQLYIDTITLTIYGPKAGGTWDAGTELGPDGSGNGDGSGFLFGAGAPLDSLGSDGDLYLDRDNLVLYGPKVGDAWPSGVTLAGGAPTAATDSALGASSDTVLLAAVGIGERPISFADDVVEVGSALTWTDTETVTVNTAGTYKVSYSVDAISASVLGGGVELRVGGAAVHTHGLVDVDTAIDDARLIEADAGDTIELVATGLSVTAALNIEASVVVELVAAD